MCQHRNKKNHKRALTVLETMLAIAILGIVAVSLGALSSAVESGSEYTFGHAAATQQAQVALLRMQNRMATATATAEFPGFVVFSETVNGRDFPDTLVVWSPPGAAANPAGPPLYRELVIYCPDPASPHEFLEIRASQDNRSTPPLSNMSRWLTELAAIKANPDVDRSVLIETLRAAEIDNAGSRRGVVRFTQRIRPSPGQWAAYQAGSVAWNNLAWVQDIHGADFGLRQSMCHIELQLLADEPGTTVSSDIVIPFFGSAALYYQLSR
jgi:hypothetical protein